MTDLTVGIISIETTTEYMDIGPFIFDGHLNDTYIEHKIREVMFEEGLDYISADMVEHIVVVFDNDDFGGIYIPKIEDVWPREFGRKKSEFRSVKKGGEK